MNELERKSLNALTHALAHKYTHTHNTFRFGACYVLYSSNNIQNFSSPEFCCFSGIQPKNEWSMFVMLTCMTACLLSRYFSATINSAWRNCIFSMLHSMKQQTLKMKQQTTSICFFFRFKYTKLNEKKDTKQNAWRCDFCHSSA